MKKENIDKIINYLEENDITVNICKYGDGSDCYELESSTDAGGDMIITLDELSPVALMDYIRDFDINEEVLMWWQGGKPGPGVPFANIKQHWDDLEEWCTMMENVAENMPYNQFIREEKEEEQWEGQKNAPRDFHLTDEDKNVLLEWGYPEEDLDQIELEANVCEFTQCYKTKADKVITRDEAIKILGRKEWLSGISRTAFHWNCGRENGKKYVHFESGLIGRSINKFQY